MHSSSLVTLCLFSSRFKLLGCVTTLFPMTLIGENLSITLLVGMVSSIAHLIATVLFVAHLISMNFYSISIPILLLLPLLPLPLRLIHFLALASSQLVKIVVLLDAWSSFFFILILFSYLLDLFNFFPYISITFSLYFMNSPSLTPSLMHRGFTHPWNHCIGSSFLSQKTTFLSTMESSQDIFVWVHR